MPTDDAGIAMLPEALLFSAESNTGVSAQVVVSEPELKLIVYVCPTVTTYELLVSVAVTLFACAKLPSMKNPTTNTITKHAPEKTNVLCFRYFLNLFMLN